MKKIIKEFWILAMLLSVALSGFAYDFSVDGIYYVINSDGKTVYVTYGSIDYSGSVVIPPTVTYRGTTYSVTSIGSHAFYECSGLKSVTIANSVTSIGSSAFRDCSGLTSVTIPNSVTSIGSNAFWNCSGLKSVTIANSVTSIGSYAFRDCSGLTSVTIPNSVTSIGDYAFEGCSGLTKVEISDIAAWCNISFGNSDANPLYYAEHLYLNGKEVTNLVIPNSVTSIGERAFSYCSGLTSVTIPNSVTSIGEKAFYDTPWYNYKPDGLVYAGKVAYKYKGTMPENTSIAIKDGTVSITSSAFEDCSGLKSVTIPNSVTSIGEDAFRDCSGLTSVTIPNTVTFIGDYAFSYCSGLTSVTIGNSVTSIGYKTFSGCSGLTSVVFNAEDCTSMGSSDYPVFYGCSNLTSLTIGENVKTIPNYAFYECSGLTSVTIPNSVTSIGSGAFSGTAWYDNQPDGLVYAGKVAYKYKGTMPDNISITIKDGTLGIAGSAFSGCSGLKSVTIPNSVTSIGEDAFRDCSGLKSVTIANSVTSIGSYAFRDCSGLKSVTIGNSVTSIGDSAFESCSGLTKVEISDIAAWCKISFGSFDANPLYYADHLYLNGKEVTNLVIPNSVTSIRSLAFYGCSGLTSVTIPNSVTSIGDYAFYYCSGLKSVTFPNSVTSIGGGAFLSCSGLTSVTIPNSVTSIGESTFAFCSALTSVTIPNSVTDIGEYAFYYCSALTSVTIGNSVTSIGSYAFSLCSGLTSVTIPNSVTSIGESTFENCSGLTSVTIGNSVTEIGVSAFSYCSNLKLVRLDATISTAPDNVVFGSSKRLSFIVGENVKSIPKNIVANGSSSVAKVVALADTPPTVTSETFTSYVTSNATLYVKKNSVSKYAFAEGWGDFNSFQSISNPITNISIDKTSINIGLGETIKLKATVQPTDATLTDVIWTSSNSCVRVDEKGNVIGQSVGQSVVTAEAIDGSGVKAECVVNVGIVLAQSISLSQNEVTMDINGLTNLSYTILPENVTIKDVEWSSSNTSVADFKVNTDKTIRVVGINTGIAYITARTTDGTNLSATCVFYVGDSGAETIDSDSVSVTAAGGAIRVEGAEDAEAEVYSLSGALLYRGTDSTIALPRGVYIVKVAGTTTKVIL